MSKMFDWSTVDRNLLASMIKMAEPTVVGVPLLPIEFSKKLKQIFKFFDLPVNIKSIYHIKTKLDMVWIGGIYESDRDEQSKKSITIITQYNQKGRKIKISKLMFKRMCYTVADTILHEVIHTRQYRRRNHKVIPGYYSTANSGKKQIEQTYLGHPDEIDAYSFNIACELNDRFKNNDKLIVDYLNTDLTDNRLTKDTYKMYLKAFDYNYKHTVIRKLKKKITYYLLNAREIGKPYKTNDWLKK